MRPTCGPYPPDPDALGDRIATVGDHASLVTSTVTSIAEAAPPL
jgi:hypothetical protein